MQRIYLALTLAAFSLGSAPVHAATDPALDKALQQMDVAAKNFKSAEADLKWDFYEKVVRDTTTQTGSTYFLKTKSGTEMGAVITTPSLKYLHFGSGKGSLYDAVSKKLTPFDAGKDRSRVESFLTLGFGGSGKDLERAWTVTLQGNDTIDGTPTVKLDLKPKDPATAQTFTHVLVWIDTARAISLKQQFFTPEGDTRTTYYSHINYNTPIDLKRYTAPKH
ncbi:MAG: LolA family protein [Janthinobacterium lividum]